MLIFVVATIINVVLSTVRSIFTVKGTPLTASVANAICYGFYTYVIVLTANGSIDLLAKIVITALANFVGVFIVKTFEKKLTKDKLWKIDLTINGQYATALEDTLKALSIPYYYNVYGKHTMFSVFCQTQKQSTKVAELAKVYNGKYFISENKGILE